MQHPSFGEGLLSKYDESFEYEVTPVWTIRKQFNNVKAQHMLNRIKRRKSIAGFQQQ